MFTFLRHILNKYPQTQEAVVIKSIGVFSLNIQTDKGKKSENRNIRKLYEVR